MLICIVFKLNGEIACLRRTEKVDYRGAPLLKILQMYLALQFGVLLSALECGDRSFFKVVSSVYEVRGEMVGAYFRILRWFPTFLLCKLYPLVTIFRLWKREKQYSITGWIVLTWIHRTVSHLPLISPPELCKQLMLTPLSVYLIL